MAMEMNDESHNIKLMILDDDGIVRAMLNRILSEDYALRSAKTHGEFREQLKDYVPDILFLDLTLPDAYGIDICRSLKNDPQYKDIFIFIVTASSDNETIEKGYRAGADDFIRKPFIPFEVKYKVSVFEKISQYRKSMNRRNITLADYNRKLFTLSNAVNREMDMESGNESSLISIGFLREIIKSDYIELIKKAEEGFSSIQVVNSDKNVFTKKFSEMESVRKILDRGEKTRSFRLSRSGRIFHCVIVSIFFKDNMSGYILMASAAEFTKEDREIVSLYADFYTLINKRISAEKNLMEKNLLYRSEISKIRKIQASSIPDLKKIRGYDIDFAYLPAEDISGDFFDGYFVSDTVYQLVLCDISGHGAASSYIGNEVRTLFRTISDATRPLSEIVKSVNTRMYNDLRGLYYFGTVVILRMNITDSTIEFINAGHPPILHFNRSTGQCHFRRSTGPLIGLFDNLEYDNEIITMAQGDAILIYTDGITEALNMPTKTMYSEEKLCHNFIGNIEYSSKEIVHLIVGSVYEFTDYGEQEDDITIISIKKLGPSPE